MTLTTHVTEQTQYKMAAILKFKMAAKIMNEKMEPMEFEYLEVYSTQ